MSVHSFVFLRDDRLPTIKEWQRALDQFNTGIYLEQVEDLRSHTGFLPARFNGHQSGFEWFYNPVGEVFDEAPKEIGDRSHAADFKTHSDMRELICGMIAGAVLAKVADGLVLDEESGDFVDGDKALEIARQAEASHL